jgi:type IV pilus assembly protein PilE
MERIKPLRRRKRGCRSSGFTLIELMVTVAVVAVLASLALPSYAAYVQRSRVPPALSALSTFQIRMELYFQDNRSYSNGTACGTAVSAVDGGNFTLSCSLTPTGGYVATAQGVGSMSEYRYTVDNFGTRATPSHPLGAPAGSCWSIRGKTCDS